MLWLLWFQASRVSQWVLTARGPQSTRKPGSRSVRVLLALVLVPAVAGQANDPCVRPCGREHSCGELNRSFSCDMLSSSEMGCDCSGCCLASLNPLAPPSPPPPLPPPPSSPRPLLPPMAPEGIAVGTTAELRATLATVNSGLVYLLPIVYPLGGEPLNVSGIDIALEGLGGDAIIDAETKSRAVEVSGGGRLVLRRIQVINGIAESGGGLLVEGAGSSLVMEQVAVRNCIATGKQLANTAPKYGGGRLVGSFVLACRLHSTRCDLCHSPCPEPPLEYAPPCFTRIGGLDLKSGTSTLLADSTISDCTANATFGGGILADRGSNLTLTNGSRVHRCESYRGGGLYAYHESHVQLLDGSMLSENVACIGAGMCSGLGCKRLMLRPPPPASLLSTHAAAPPLSLPEAQPGSSWVPARTFAQSQHRVRKTQVHRRCSRPHDAGVNHRLQMSRGGPWLLWLWEWRGHARGRP